MINIPHFQAECHGNREVLPQRLHANVYMPPYFVDRYPQIRLPIASAVQAVIQGVGVPFINHVKQSYEERNWDYGTNVTMTDGGPPAHNAVRATIPNPYQKSSQYRFWGYHSYFGPTVAAEPVPADILMLEDQIRELETTIAAARNELANQSREIEGFQREIARLRSSSFTPSRSQQRGQLETVPRAFDLPRTSLGSPSLQAALRSQEMRGAPLSQTAREVRAPVPPSQGSASSTPSGSTAFASSSGAETSIGVETIRALRALPHIFDNSVHEELWDIVTEYDEEDWEDALTRIRGIGFNHSEAIATAMRMDLSRRHIAN